MPRLALLAATAVITTASLASAPAVQAGETFRTCVGFIDTLPATITTQGVWCLRKDLSTAITSGNAITIATNNVTIDCNNFKVGGLAAGSASNAVGIRAVGHMNITIRRCNVRGFDYGIHLGSEYSGDAGHVVADNLLDQNLRIGIRVEGDNNLVIRNRVHDTGGKIIEAVPGFKNSIGIQAQADIVDNVVTGLYGPVGDEGTHTIRGIMATGAATRVSGNTVSELLVPTKSSRTVHGIYAAADSINFYGNHVSIGSVAVPANVRNVTAFYARPTSLCSDNMALGFPEVGSAACVEPRAP